MSSTPPLPDTGRSVLEDCRCSAMAPTSGAAPGPARSQLEAQAALLRALPSGRPDLPPVLWRPSSAPPELPASNSLVLAVLPVSLHLRVNELVDSARCCSSFRLTSAGGIGRTAAIAALKAARSSSWPLSAFFGSSRAICKPDLAWYPFRHLCRGPFKTSPACQMPCRGASRHLPGSARTSHQCLWAEAFHTQ